MNKVSVCLILKGFHHGGVERVFESYFSAMNRENLDLHIVTHMKAYEPRKKLFEDMGFTIHELSPIHITRLTPQNFHEYRALFKNNRFDVVHNNFPEYLLPLYFAKKSNVSLRILHTHNDYRRLTEILSPLKRKVYRSIIDLNIRKNSNMLIGCGETAFRNTFGLEPSESKHIILNNAVDLARFAYDEETRKRIRTELGIGKECVVGHVGRYEDLAQKNQPFVLDVFENFIQKKPDSILLMIGEGKYREYVTKLAKDKGIRDRVVFTGAITNVNEYLQAMDYFVFPSLHEGLGISVVEAQASGLPCIVSKNVPKEACLTDKCRQIDLNKGAEYWADELIDMGVNHYREDYYKRKEMLSYDTYSCAEQLKRIYLGC